MNPDKSAISLSMHKAGSTVANKIFCKFFGAKGYEINQISSLVPSSPLSEADVFINYQSSIKNTGFYYGIARGAYVSKLSAIRDLKILVQVRDPRDCLTSAYFSFKNSHRLPIDPDKLDKFMERRNSLEKLNIDDYVIKQMNGYSHRMHVLKDIIEDHQDILLLKYEDMVLKTEQWLSDISNFLDQPITDALHHQLKKDIDFSVSFENVNKHKRQVSPGDHKGKLKSSTIKSLNEGLSSSLEFFGYTNL